MNQSFFFAASIFLFTLLWTPETAQAVEPGLADKDWQQTISEFQESRNDTLEFEKWLYRRINKIDKRTIRLTNLVIGGFVLLLIGNLGGFYLMKRGRNPGMVETSQEALRWDVLKRVKTGWGTLTKIIFTGVKKAVVFAPYGLLLFSFIVASIALVGWFYVDRACENCQSLNNIYSSVEEKLFPKPKTMVVHRGQEVELVSGDAIVQPSTDVHGDSQDETQLPILELLITKTNERKLRDAMPAWNGSAQSLPHFKWPLVNAQLNYQNQSYPMKVRYRGWYYDHYRLPHKQSWRFQFPKSNLFNGMRAVNVINQRAISTFHESLQYEILRRHGFLLAQQKLVHYRKNGKYVGVQTFLEQPSDHFLTRNNMPVGPIYGERHTLGNWSNFTNLDNWQIYSGDKKNYEPFKRLYTALKLKGTDEFEENIKKILDVDQYLSYLANVSITLKYNPSSHNNRLYFDPKKGKFQLLPWYQKTEHYKSLNPEKERGLYWVLNDFAYGLFLVPEYLEEFQKNIWKLINSTYHPRALVDLLEQVIAASEADIIADSYQHSLGDGKYVSNKYVSNKEWRELVPRYRRSFSIFDKNVRTQLAKSELEWNWIPENLKNKMPSDKLGIVRFQTESLVAPKLNAVCFSFKSPVSNAAQLTLRAGSRGNILPAQLNRQDKRACFELNHTIRAKLTAKEQTWRKNPGALITGFPWEALVVMAGGPQEYDYELRVTPSNDRFPEIDKVEVTAVNGITGAPIDKPVDEVVAESLAKPLAAEYYYQFSPAIDDHARFEPSPGLKRWYLPEGDYATRRDLVWRKGEAIHIEDDTILEEEVRLVIEPGTEVLLSPGKSLIIEGALVAKGTEDEPIVFRSSSTDAPFGVVAIVNTKNRENHLRHVKISNGSHAEILDVSYLGALSIYNADALLENVTFEENLTGDAINAVYSRTRIVNSLFRNNADCIDYDFSSGAILNNTFENCNDDVIDISHSNTLIDGNLIHKAGDKGISIGEKSQPVVSNNTIESASIGIAVKDLSTPKLLNNRILNNDIGIALYIKKPEFGPPTAELNNNHFEGNRKNISVDNGILVNLPAQ